MENFFFFQIAYDNHWVAIVDVNVLSELCKKAIDKLSQENPEFRKVLEEKNLDQYFLRQIVNRAVTLSNGKASKKILKTIAETQLKEIYKGWPRPRFCP